MGARNSFTAIALAKLFEEDFSLETPIICPKNQKYFNETDGSDNKKDIVMQLLLFSMCKLEKGIEISDEKFLKLLELWAENFPLFINK
ncbi:hypothetical protein R84B8_01422 [Treponema sp. R8-4-B8]